MNGGQEVGGGGGGGREVIWGLRLREQEGEKKERERGKRDI